MKRVVAFLLFLMLTIPGLAQLNRGTITGSVVDSTGAAVPAAQIVIRSVETNATYKTATTATGQYTMPNLPTGSYEVTAEAAGFKKFVRSNIELGVTQVIRIDATLEIGALSETVQVSAEAPRVQTESPEVGTSLQNNNIIDLPLSFSGARSPETFAYKLTPGVTGDSWTSHINGSSGFSKEVLLDGASVSTYLSGHFGESTTSLEAVEEFKIQTSGMSAEFGRTQGGVFNFVLKSGNNQVHGSAYGALRNEALNANSFTNKFNGRKRPLDRKQNYAGSFGGPIYIPKVYDGRNKTFFYTTYERYRERTGGFGSPNRSNPLPEFYDGDFSRLLQTATAGTDALLRAVQRGAIYDPLTFRQMPGSTRWVGDMFPGNVIPKSRISQVAQKLNAISREHYMPQIKDASGQYVLLNNAVFPASQTPVYDQYQFSEKVDQIISDRMKLSGSYTYVKRPRLLLDQGGMWDITSDDGGPLSKARNQAIKSQMARVAFDFTISPRVLNNVNVAWNRMANPNISAHVSTDGAKELGIKNLTTSGFPAIDWGGGPYVSLVNPGDPQNDFQAYTGDSLTDTLSYSKGRHFIKVGIDFRSNSMSLRPTAGGSFTFNARSTAIPNESFSGSQTGYAFASYLLGIVYSAGRSVPLPLGGRRHYYGSFIQDDFKVRSNLTLNLGLRWDFGPPYFEVGARQASWSPNEIDPQTGLKGAYRFAGNCNGCTGQNYFGKRDYKGFAPRLGLAWQPMKDWTLRAGYGIFYEADLFDGFSAIPGASAFPWQGTYNLSSDAVTPWAGIFNWDDGFPTSRYIAPAFDKSRANISGASMIDPNYGVGEYTQQWNFNIQRNLPGNILLDIGYVGNKASRMKNNSLVRLNQLPASVLAQYGRSLTNAVTNADQAAANGIAYPFPGYKGTVAGALRQFPQLQGTNTIAPYGTPIGSSTYNSLQITANRQFKRGLSIYANYVWSRNFANTTSSMTGDNTGPLDYYNLKLEKAPTPYDIPHMFKGYVQYELPFGNGRALLSGVPKVVSAIISGWQISTIMNYYNGAPIGFGGASNPIPGGWNGGQRPNIAAGNMYNTSFDKHNFNYVSPMDPANTYLNKSLFSDPAAFTLGTSAVRYSQIRGFGTISEDGGLLKNFRVSERYRFQIRAEFLNMFNRHQLGGPSTSVTSANFGQITSVSGNRSIQIGARMDF